MEGPMTTSPSERFDAVFRQTLIDIITEAAQRGEIRPPTEASHRVTVSFDALDRLAKLAGCRRGLVEIVERVRLSPSASTITH
jgi:hypothetical protein